jgi:hypothetical protein
MYSISLQPEFDTPGVLADYPRSRGFGPGWLLLSGQLANIELLRHRLGFVGSNPADDAKRGGAYRRRAHRQRADSRWIISPALLNAIAIVRTVKWVIQKPPDAQRIFSGRASVPLADGGWLSGACRGKPARSFVQAPCMLPADSRPPRHAPQGARNPAP